MSQSSFSRRGLLRLGKQAAFAGAASSLLPLQAALSGGNRTVVCIYLFGGNDSNNMVVGLDQYSSYANSRGKRAIPRNSLLNVTTTTSQTDYGFHPSMTEVSELFSAGRLAVVANAGRIGKASPPTDRNTAKAEFASLSVTDDSLSYLPGAYVIPGWAAELAKTRTVTSYSDANGLVRVGGAPKSQSNEIQTRFPQTDIGKQLKAVAADISAGGGGQVFLVQMGGFGTDPMRHAELLGELSYAMSAFYRATLEFGAANRVVTYTDTEFNRALAPNAKGKLEKGWGGHHLVMGGSVIGGEVYGSMPSMRLGGHDDVTGTGVWLPTIAKAQFNDAFSRWLGLSPAATAAPGVSFLT